MRRLIGCLLGCAGALVGCAPQRPPPVAPLPSAAAPDGEGGPAPRCQVRARRLSALGRAATRPDIAANGATFGVVWEDADEAHRGIRFQPLDLEAKPLGPAVEVADLSRGGAEPRVIADGDGFLVGWTVDDPETSVIAMRRLDARGKPRGDVVAAVTSKNARALALSRTSDGFAVVWWSWVSAPPLQAVTFLDGEARPRGAPVELSRTPLVDPMAAILADGDALLAAWEEQHDGVEHIFTGRVTAAGVGARLDVGPGDSPSLTQKGVVFAHLDEAAIFWSPLEVAQPARFTDGQYPDARPLGPTRGVLCVVRQSVADDASVDELDCLALVRGEPVRDDLIAQAPHGLVAQRVAPTPDALGVVYQTEEPDAMAVHLATAKCPASATP
jgi:hypothetical protein